MNIIEIKKKVYEITYRLLLSSEKDIDSIHNEIDILREQLNSIQRAIFDTYIDNLESQLKRKKYTH
jgi:hypothetical protein